MDYVKELKKQNERQQQKIESETRHANSGNGQSSEKRQSRQKPPPQPEKSTPANINTWGMLIHLSQFCTGIFPLAGIAFPIVLWQIKKDESDIINQHGRNVVNWLITEVIFLVASLILMPACGIGFIPLTIVIVVGIVFPIIGAVKASKGEVWKYPCSIEFIKQKQETLDNL